MSKLSVEQRGDRIIVRGIQDYLLYLSESEHSILSLTEKDAAILAALLTVVVKDRTLAWR